jgi:hypothetical protein
MGKAAFLLPIKLAIPSYFLIQELMFQVLMFLVCELLICGRELGSQSAAGLIVHKTGVIISANANF